MKLKEGFKKIMAHRKLFITVCVLVLTISSIGISYSAFFSVKSNTNDQTVKTGTLSVTYSGNYLGGSNGSTTPGATDSLSVKDLLPLPDKEGLKATQSKIIYIQNTGTLDSEYILTVGYDMPNFGKRANPNTSDTLTPVEYIRVAVYDYNSQNGESTLIAGPISIGDLPIYKYDAADYRNNRYSLLIGNVGNSTSGKSSKTYRVKVWLSDKATPLVSNTFFYVNSEIEASVTGAQRDYTLNGSLLDSGGVGIAGATIKFHNGSATIQTASDGTFSIPNIPAGTYNISINAKNKDYEGNLIIKADETATSVASVGTSFNATADSTLFGNAYVNGTTIGKLMSENGIKDLSNTYKFKAGSVKLSPTFMLKAATAKVENLKITVDGTKISSMSI